DRSPRAVPGSREEGQGRPPGRLARLVQHALPGAARPGEGPALRLVRRSVWCDECSRDDRRRAGKVGVAARAVRIVLQMVPPQWRAAAATHSGSPDLVLNRYTPSGASTACMSMSG